MKNYILKIFLSIYFMALGISYLFNSCSSIQIRVFGVYWPYYFNIILLLGLGTISFLLAIGYIYNKKRLLKYSSKYINIILIDIIGKMSPFFIAGQINLNITTKLLLLVIMLATYILNEIFCKKEKPIEEIIFRINKNLNLIFLIIVITGAISVCWGAFEYIMNQEKMVNVAGNIFDWYSGYRSNIFRVNNMLKAIGRIKLGGMVLLLSLLILYLNKRYLKKIVEKII